MDDHDSLSPAVKTITDTFSVGVCAYLSTDPLQGCFGPRSFQSTCIAL